MGVSFIFGLFTGRYTHYARRASEASILGSFKILELVNRLRNSEEAVCFIFAHNSVENVGNFLILARKFAALSRSFSFGERYRNENLYINTVFPR